MDKEVLKDCKRGSANLTMAWVDYRKAYDMIPHSWISECLEVFGIAGNTKNFLVNSINKWKLKLTLKLFAKSNDQVDSLVNTVRLQNQTIKSIH